MLHFYNLLLEANSRKKKVYEQQENEENPLRCPVKLYEFYLSKWYVLFFFFFNNIYIQTIKSLNFTTWPFIIVYLYCVLTFISVRKVLKRAMMYSIYCQKEVVYQIVRYGIRHHHLPRNIWWKCYIALKWLKKLM